MRNVINQGGRDLTYLPSIWAGQPAWDFSIGQEMQRDTGFLAEPLSPSPYFLNGVDGDGEPAFSGKTINRGPVEIDGPAHVQKDTSCIGHMQACIRLQNISHADTRSMAPEWKKRPLFLAWIDDAKEKMRQSGGKGTNAEIALVMGLAYNSLKKYLAADPGPHRPSWDAISKLGTFLERDYRLLMDGLDTSPEGIPQADWDSASEELKGFTIRMFYQGRPLAPEQLRAVEAMVKAGRALGRERKARGE